MDNFKEQFNHVLQETPSFSSQARERVKQKLESQKKKLWMPMSIASAVAVAAVSLFAWNNDWFGPSNNPAPVQVAAPEHKDEMEIFTEIEPDQITQFVISNEMNSMNRGNAEYIGGLTIESSFEHIEYGQVLLLKDEVKEQATYYTLGRVIGKPGDKVEIQDGQLYLNELPIETFYGKAHIMGTTDVEEAFERLKKVNSTQWKDTIEEALHTTMAPVTLKENELFIVSDNWARNSVRKVYTNDQVEGIVLGYGPLTTRENAMTSWRKLTAEELEYFKALSKEIFDKIRQNNFDRHKLAMDINIDNLTDEIVDHYINYYRFINLGNSNIALSKHVVLGYRQKDSNSTYYIYYGWYDGEWVYRGEYVE